VSIDVRSTVLGALTLAAAVAFSACSSGSTSDAGARSTVEAASTTQSAPATATAPNAVTKVAAAEAVDMLEGRTVIDVRSPAEYGSGHVAGAVNIDVEADTFDAQIATLDKHEAYLVYCKSGRRSALAAQRMAEAGFTDIVDAGGFESLAAAGATLE
jgi:rhodanese-related sulfurtransferase